MNCNNSCTLAIKKIVNGGYGLTSLDNGKTVLVRQGLPEETVEVKIIEKQKHLNYAEVTKVIDPHKGRIVPLCTYYRECGGCNFQHVDYFSQCLLKKQILLDLLQRNESTKNIPEQCLMDVLPSSQQFGYRQRIRLKVSQRGIIGFNRFRTHDIVPVRKCLLAPDIINNSLAIIAGSKNFNKLSLTVQEIDIQQNPADETVCIMLDLNRKPRPGDRKASIQLAGEIGPGTRVFHTGSHFATEGPYCANTDRDDKTLRMQLPESPPLELSWEAGGFCQVNLVQNFQLIRLVIDFCKPTISDRVLDLYCGMGNFSLPLAQLVTYVHGIESQGAAVRSAKRNSIVNHLTNVNFSKSDVPEACRKLCASKESFDIIICDPPRQGMIKAAPLLAKLCTDRLVYISCDPATLCRDLCDLTNAGFTIKKIQPVDMFPQTHHIETVTLLEKD